MDIMSPEIDDLLDRTERNPFLLCSIASKRAADINNMLHGQRLRVVEAQGFDDVTSIISGEDPISIAMREIEDGTLSYDKNEFEQEIQGEDVND